MNSRERVRAALNHIQPDRVPLDFGSTNVTTIHKIAYKNLIEQLNIKDENIKMMDLAQQLVIPCEEVLQYFDIDTRPIKLRHSKASNCRFINEDSFVDDWGLLWKKPEGGLYFDTNNAPLSYALSVEEILKYPWPDALTLASADGVRLEAENLFYNTPYSMIGSFGSSIFMRAQLLRGYEQLFIDMMTEPELAEAILDKILEIRISLAEMLLKECGEFLDVIELADDVSGQSGPILSPELYRKMIKPRTKALIDAIKARSDVKVMYHCCGSVMDFVEDFIEIGIDIINPVQVSARNMDTKVLKEAYGDRIVFWGAIDAQRVLPAGTTEDVKYETAKRVEELGKNGGYVAFASHNIQADVKPENIIAMFNALR